MDQVLNLTLSMFTKK